MRLYFFGWTVLFPRSRLVRVRRTKTSLFLCNYFLFYTGRSLRALTPFRDRGYGDEEEARRRRSRQEFGTFTVWLFVLAPPPVSLPLTQLDREGFADAASNWWWKNTLVRSLTTPLAPSATTAPVAVAHRRALFHLPLLRPPSFSLPRSHDTHLRPTVRTIFHDSKRLRSFELYERVNARGYATLRARTYTRCTERKTWEGKVYTQGGTCTYKCAHTHTNPWEREG